MNRELILWTQWQCAEPFAGNMGPFSGTVIILQNDVYCEQKEQTNTHLLHMLHILFTVRGAASEV